MPKYDFRCSKGHTFSREMSRETFVDVDHVCKCGAKAKRALIPVMGGVAKVERDVQYPYYNWQIPLLPGQKPGEPNVMSRAHEANIMAGSIGGRRYEKNAVTPSDYASQRR